MRWSHVLILEFKPGWVRRLNTFLTTKHPMSVVRTERQDNHKHSLLLHRYMIYFSHSERCNSSATFEFWICIFKNSFGRFLTCLLSSHEKGDVKSKCEIHNQLQLLRMSKKYYLHYYSWLLYSNFHFALLSHMFSCMWSSSRVFLLGPSHHYYTPKCALTRATIYSTPIGDLPVDHEGMLLLSFVFVWLGYFTFIILHAMQSVKLRSLPKISLRL